MKIIIYVLSLFLLVASVLAAASLDVPNSVDFYAEQGEESVEDFTIKNNGDVKLTNILFSFDNVDPEYSAGFSEESDGTYTSTLNIASLAVDASKKIYVKITTSDEIGSKEIGNILIDANEIDQKSIPINEHIGGLDIIDVDAKIGKREKAYNNLEDGVALRPDYTRPGEPVKFEIDIENLFSKDSENEIRNIRINVIIAEIDDGEDLEEESDDIDLKPEDSYRETFEFNIPTEVEEDEFDVIINVEGEDDHGITREIDWILKLNIEKRSHDVKIYSTSLSPTKIICGGNPILSTTIYNFGSSTEDKVKLTIKNSDLGINIEEYPIELDNDLFEEESKWSKSFTIPVSKAQKTGVYPIDIWLYYSEDVSDDYKKLELNVESCPVEEEEEEEPVIVCGNNIVETGEECDDGNKVSGDGCSATCKKEEIEEEKEEEEQITGGTVITETEEEGNPWIAILVGVNVLVLIIIIVLVFLMFRKKGEGEDLE